MGRRPLYQEDWELRKRIAANIKAARIKKFSTQQEFADALTASGLPTTKSAVSLWEAAFRVPEVVDLYKMSALLGLTVQKLLP